MFLGDNGGTTSFNGFIRQLKIYSKYLNFAYAASRMRNDLHKEVDSSLLYYYPLNEASSSIVLEFRQDSTASFSFISMPFATFPERLEVCLGDTQYVHTGYC